MSLEVLTTSFKSDNSKTELTMIHLGILNVILGFGDGILDISHLSLIAVIARDQMEAVEMNSLRTSFSYLSGILTFVVAWVIFGLDSESQLSESSSRDFMRCIVSLEFINLILEHQSRDRFAYQSQLNTANKKNRPSRKRACVTFWDEIPSTSPKDDKNESQTLSNEEEAPIDNLQSCSSSLNNPDFTGVVSKGRCVSVLERYSDDRESTGTSRASKESSPSDVSAVSLDTKSVSFSQTKSDRNPVVKSCNRESGLPRSTRGNKTVRRWLIDPRLYLVSIAYSCTWMLQIHAYSYLPLFLIHRLRFNKESIAYLPLILTISATVSSSILKKIVQKIGDKLCIIFAAIFAIIAGVMSYFMEAESWTSKVMIYPTVILLGFAFSSMFVSSLSFATELIGKNTKTTGFVFAVMTLIASVTNGSLLMTIQELFPEQRDKDCEECGDYLRLFFSLVNVAVAIVSMVTVLLLYCINRFNGKSSSSDQDSETST
ncbi:PREDICTED: uncharacterized protein LOC107328101 [Acropora digitifera]|uniref:uncharacterized protein LOC107328101 n=1 Tax=Acropora digitifera TaxID=70779 RepID=UPI00077A24C8|nr:PREDICTED: uncharacterized protein LOC107328101 [Acropora digitifera]